MADNVDNIDDFIIEALKCFAENSKIKQYPQDWGKCIELCSQNSIIPIIYRTTGTNELKTFYNKTAAVNFLYENEIKRIFKQFAISGTKAILMRGLYLGCNIYRDTALRPFKDIDILVERENIKKAEKALKALGYYYSPALFPKELFLDMHLHIVYLHPKYRLACEVHWAVDHPFTLYNINIKELFENSFIKNVCGIQYWDIMPELRAILLLAHIHKHSPYIKYLYNSSNIRRVIIKNGEILHLLDVYLFLKNYSNVFSWQFFTEKAAHWNIDSIMYSALKTIENIFHTAVIPEKIFTKLSPPVQRPLEKILSRIISTVSSNNTLIAGITKKLVFTSKRIPDLYIWFLPDRKTIIMKYKLASNKWIFLCYIDNFIKCIIKLLKIFIKYISLKLHHLSQQASSL